MNFILDAQAKAEVRMAQHEEWLAKHEKAVATLDKQLKATANLLRGAIRVGARELRRINEQQRITNEKLAELAESQRKTDQTFQAFMKSFGKSTNGN
jgi:uncharacterized protein YigA (DUF484 family)